MAEKEQQDVVTRAADSPMHQQTVEEVTPEQQEWLRLAGFSRKDWQRLVYARWRYRQGMLTDYPQASESRAQ